MQVYSSQPLLGSSIAEKIGGGFMDAARGVLSLASKARGDQEDMYVPSGPSIATIAVFCGLFAAALYVAVKK